MAEETSIIAWIAYEIENMLFKGKSENDIEEFITKIKENGIEELGGALFPEHLVFVDGFYDASTGTSGCAFMDTRTGEVIVGFAGTNWDNGMEETAKDLNTDFALASGHKPDGFHLKPSNDFVEELRANGYQVTQATGHSLGGAICVSVGISQSIAVIVTYNGAPIKVPVGQVIDSVIKSSTIPVLSLFQKIDHYLSPNIETLYEDYDGTIIRFVTNNDFLNNTATILGATYFGDAYVLSNGGAHGIDFFFNDVEQAYMKEVLLANGINPALSLLVDINLDGTVDIGMSSSSLIVKNLFGVNGRHSLNPNEFSVNPEALYQLERNLIHDVLGNDFIWIEDVIKKCIEKNELLKQTKAIREERLIDDVIEGLNRAELSILLDTLEDVHGGILQNIGIIQNLTNFDPYQITRNFDQYGTSSNRKWYMNGVPIDEDDLIYWIKELKSKAQDLEGEVKSYQQRFQVNPSFPALKIRNNTLSTIAEDYVAVTQKIATKSNEVFKGSGLRQGREDGIVLAIEEVLKVEQTNTTSLKQQIQALANMARGIGDHFKEMDVWLKQAIESGGPIKDFSSHAQYESYENYLEEQGILDDVKDVLEAYDLQVEKESKQLSNQLKVDFEDLTENASNKTSSLYYRMETFRHVVNELIGRLDAPITSMKYVPRYDDYGNWDREEVYQSHGTLSGFFPGHVVDALYGASNTMIPKLDGLNRMMNRFASFKANIQSIDSYIHSVVEKAVYHSQELDGVVSSHVLLGLRIGRMIEELKFVERHLMGELKGVAIVSFASNIQQVQETLSYYRMMIEDCFGNKQVHRV